MPWKFFWLYAYNSLSIDNQTDYQGELFEQTGLSSTVGASASWKPCSWGLHLDSPESCSTVYQQVWGLAVPLASWAKKPSCLWLLRINHPYRPIWASQRTAPLALPKTHSINPKCICLVHDLPSCICSLQKDPRETHVVRADGMSLKLLAPDCWSFVGMSCWL